MDEPDWDERDRHRDERHRGRGPAPQEEQTSATGTSATGTSGRRASLNAVRRVGRRSGESRTAGANDGLRENARPGRRTQNQRILSSPLQ